MNDWERQHRQAQKYKEAYPPALALLKWGILFFVKVGTSYFEYRKHGQFEFAAPCILFAVLIALWKIFPVSSLCSVVFDICICYNNSHNVKKYGKKEQKIERLWKKH